MYSEFWYPFQTYSLWIVLLSDLSPSLYRTSQFFKNPVHSLLPLLPLTLHLESNVFMPKTMPGVVFSMQFYVLHLWHKLSLNSSWICYELVCNSIFLLSMEIQFSLHELLKKVSFLHCAFLALLSNVTSWKWSIYFFNARILLIFGCSSHYSRVIYFEDR